MNDVDLAIRLTADASDAAAAMDDVGDASKRMADDVEASTRSADAAADRMDGLAESSDHVASKGAQAAGALSGLGDLVGGKFGAAMMAGGVATQALADGGDLLNVVTESNIVRKIKDTAVTIGQRAANLASAAATRTAAAAQWAWNAAMSANPIAIVVLAVAALVAGFILLYKRSERFRAIVQAVMRAARAAIERVWDVLKRVGSFVVNVLVGYFKVYRAVATAVFNAVRAVATGAFNRVMAIARGARDVVVGVWNAVRDKARSAWDGIRQLVADAVGRIRDLAQSVRDKFTDVWNGVKSAGVKVFDALTKPIQTIIDKVQSVLDLISKIDLPDLGDLNPFAAGFSGTPSGTPAVATPSGPVTININVTAGVGDPIAIASTIQDVLAKRVRYLGIGG